MYERVFGGLGGRRPLARPAWTAVGAVGLVAIAIAIGALASKASGPVVAALFMLASFAALGCYLLLWLDVVLRVHRRILGSTVSGGMSFVLLVATIWLVPIATLAAGAAVVGWLA